ncbi:hypothetical protein Tco_1194074 [Tanacetum coccineum]|uniref:Uncharacterized protein n=1 Tax=Tanacetum coccineum TaxID=301880 RepID=A0ABQ5B1C4_9ASTR
MVKFVFHLLDFSWAKEFHQDRASSIKVPVANFTLQSSVQLLRENTDSVRSNQRIRASHSLMFLLYCQHIHCCSLCFRAGAVTRSATSPDALEVMAGASDVDVLLGGILST